VELRGDTVGAAVQRGAVVAGQTAGLVVPNPTHDAKYWAGATLGLDFTDADRVDPAVFNRILWAGMKANMPYPAVQRR